MDKIRQYEGTRKNIIQIGEYIMLSSRRFGFSSHHQDLDIKIVHIVMDAYWDDWSQWEIFKRYINELWTLCAHLCIFSLYISLFAPVISASIHRYVNYFDIQVLMMVTETETLISSLHHNIFIYLDCVFFCYLHINIYIYIYKHKCILGLIYLEIDKKERTKWEERWIDR